jgi:hypothetical protein
MMPITANLRHPLSPMKTTFSHRTPVLKHRNPWRWPATLPRPLISALITRPSLVKVLRKIFDNALPFEEVPNLRKHGG